MKKIFGLSNLPPVSLKIDGGVIIKNLKYGQYYQIRNCQR